VMEAERYTESNKQMDAVKSHGMSLRSTRASGAVLHRPR
jgi:hypothetical protein